MIILYLSQQKNTFSKSTKETLKITEDNPDKNIFKKQPQVVFHKKNALKNFAKFIGKRRCQSFYFNKTAWGLY